MYVYDSRCIGRGNFVKQAVGYFDTATVLSIGLEGQCIVNCIVYGVPVPADRFIESGRCKRVLETAIDVSVMIVDVGYMVVRRAGPP